MAEYPVLPVQPEDLIGDEALGSKTKFWFRREGQRWLFKEAREGTGEDWAEKVAAEVAHLFGVPAATVELADFQGRRGCASLSFVHPEAGEGLIHGNEILAGMVLGYDRAKKFHQSDHTLDNIQTAIRKLFPEEGVHNGVLTTLAGYLVLDASRLLARPRAPGRQAIEHPSIRRRWTLRPKRQRSDLLGVFRQARSEPPATAEFGARRLSAYFLPAIRQLERISPADFKRIMDSVPVVRMSDVSKDFTLAFLTYTYEALTKLLK